MMTGASDERRLSDNEKKVVRHLADAWNEFCRLPKGHPGGAGEFTFHVHALQNIVASRVAKRCDPDLWR